MKTPFTLLILVTCLAGLRAEDKPTIYNHVGGAPSEIDKQVDGAWSSKYKVVDLPDDGYAQPKVTEGHLPQIARSTDGKLLNGYVLVAYVIQLDGRVTDPVVLKTDDKRLNETAVKSLEKWRFTPATLHGKPIATAAAQEFNFETTPTEFATQVLEPTGGKVPMPKGWFYKEAHQGPKYVWTLSKEDLSKEKRYITGERIQVFTGIEKGTGKTAKEFMLGFMESKKKEADKVIDSCEPKDLGLFTRVCLETEEGPFHIRYSLFWLTSGGDVAAVTIAGTTKELWEVYAPTFDKMSTVELIDMKRFEK